MLWFSEIASLPAQVAARTVGPKAAVLARAFAAGLRVPEGLVLPAPLALPAAPALAAALRVLAARVAAAGIPIVPGRFAVRSSSAREDLAGRSAAGLFLSQVGVPLARVLRAAAAVRGATLGPALRRYLGEESPKEVAVLIQPQVAAVTLGVLQLAPDDEVLLEERAATEPEWAAAVPRRLSAVLQGGDAALRAGALALRAILSAAVEEEQQGERRASAEATRWSAAPEGAARGAAPQVEYARTADGGCVFLQARLALPAVVAPERSWPAPPLPLEYRFDRGHNPEPLSPAQAALVMLVNDEETSPTLHQHVSNGYLYFARRPGAEGRGGLTALRQRVLPACEAQLAVLEQRLPPLRPVPGADRGPRLWQRKSEGADALGLAETLVVFRQVFQAYVVSIGPALLRARADLDGFLQEQLGEGLEAHPALLLGVPSLTTERARRLWELDQAYSAGGRSASASARLQRLLERFGAYAPAWDLACPCDDEAPERLLQQVRGLAQAAPDPALHYQRARRDHEQHLAAVLQRLAPRVQVAFRGRLGAARRALALGEADDLLFFRAQRLVRWALLGLGARLRAAGRLAVVEDVFYLPLVLDQIARAAPAPRLSVDAAVPGLPEELAALAEAGRRAQDAQRCLRPPERFTLGQPRFLPGPVGATAALLLRGVGVPAQDPQPRRGVVRVITHLGGAAPSPDALRGAVLVLPVLLPAWAPLLLGAAALVTDSGGALSHGATLARELDLPAVLQTGDATRVLRDGEEVLVDARDGCVYRLDAG